MKHTFGQQMPMYDSALSVQAQWAFYKVLVKDTSAFKNAARRKLPTNMT
jgi:hypothetical protein